MFNGNNLRDVLLFFLEADLFFNTNLTAARIAAMFCMIIGSNSLVELFVILCNPNLKHFLTLNIIILVNIYIWASEPILYIACSFTHTFFGFKPTKYNDPLFILKIIAIFNIIYFLRSHLRPYMDQITCASGYS